MNNQYDKQGKYRSEIDGLRAFAVIAVIINHFNKNILPGGYLGVDIFFVISGYVLTSSVSVRKSKSFGDFISGFYERRIKRLIPALVTFILITSFLICFFRVDSSGSLKTGITSLFGVSNIALFWKSWDYFAPNILLNPFAHTWSLGVEEQFYFLFPFFIWFSGFGRQSNKGERNIIILFLFLTICSLISFVYLYSNNQPAGYFLMPARFWEIATGCLLFFGIKKKSYFFQRLENIDSLFLLTLIIGIMCLPSTFGAFSTISIVILSSILISSLRKGTSVYKLFTNKNVVYIGLLSYSLYLWHWGILSISRWTIGILWWSIPLQIGLIFFIAISSYEFIEKPFRRNEWSLKRSQTILKGTLTLILSAGALLGLEKPLKGKLFLGETKNYSRIEKPFFNSFQIDEDFCQITVDNKQVYDNKQIFSKCFYKNKNYKQTLFFLGDSHTNSLWLAAEDIAKKTKSNLFVFGAGHASFPSIKYFRTDSKKRLLKYNQIINSLQREILSRVKEGDVIFITMHMHYYFGEDWYRYPVENFRYFDNKNQVVSRNSKKEYFEEWLISIKDLSKDLFKKKASIVITMPTPEFPYANTQQCKSQNPQWFNIVRKKDCSVPITFFTNENGKYYQIIERLKEVSSEYENLYIFDALSAMCPNEQCKYSAAGGELLYRDGDHISNFGAANFISPKLLKFVEDKNILISN